MGPAPPRVHVTWRHRPARPTRGERRRQVTALVRTRRAGLRAAPGRSALTSQVAWSRPTLATAQRDTALRMVTAREGNALSEIELLTGFRRGSPNRLGRVRGP